MPPFLDPCISSDTDTTREEAGWKVLLVPWWQGSQIQEGPVGRTCGSCCPAKDGHLWPSLQQRLSPFSRHSAAAPASPGIWRADTPPIAALQQEHHQQPQFPHFPLSAALGNDNSGSPMVSLLPTPAPSTSPSPQPPRHISPESPQLGQAAVRGPRNGRSF